MPVGTAKAGFKFGEAVAKLWSTWLVSRDKRRMQVAIEVGEKYIQVNEKSGEFKGINDKRQEELLSYYSRKFFRHN